MYIYPLTVKIKIDISPPTIIVKNALQEPRTKRRVKLHYTPKVIAKTLVPLHIILTCIKNKKKIYKLNEFIAG